MKKRRLSFLLALLMVVSIFPAPAYATDSTDVTVTPTETPTEEATEIATETACPTCGTVGCTSEHLTWCPECKVDDCGKTHVFCEICQKNDCGQNHCPTCGTIDCIKEHKKCDKCGTMDCTADHTNWCDICKADNCGKNHCPVCRAVDCTVDHDAPAPTAAPTEPVQPASDEETPDYSGDVGKYVKLNEAIVEFTVYGLTPSTGTLDTQTFIHEDFQTGTILRIADWMMMDETVWYQVTFYKGGTQGSYVGDFPAEPWFKQTEAGELVFLSTCGICSKPDCAGHTWCETCEKYDCGKDHTQPPVAPEVPELDDEKSGIVLKGTFPTDVSLSVEPADVSSQLSQFGVSGEKLVFGLDISLMRSGADYQPGAAVRVKVPVFAAAGKKIGILHTHGGETTYMGLTEVLPDGTVEFTTDRFSTFAGFTVDFHSNGIDYSIPGLTSITLSELFGILEINRDVAHVVDVKFSDTTLVSVTKIDGDWQLESLQAFDTEETLEITFYNGEIITIKVTDATQQNLTFSGTDIKGHFSSGISTKIYTPTVYLYKGDSSSAFAWATSDDVCTNAWLALNSDTYWFEYKSGDKVGEHTNPYNPLSGQPDYHALAMGGCDISIWFGGSYSVHVKCWPRAISSNYGTVTQASEFVKKGDTTRRKVEIYVDGELKQTIPNILFPNRENSITASDITNVSPNSGYYKRGDVGGGSTVTTYSTDTYRIWLVTAGTVIYDANGGTGAPDNQVKYHGIELTLRSGKPKKEHATFKGWATTKDRADEGRVDYSAGAKYTANLTSGSTTTLYAVWEMDKYTITYDHNNADGETPATTATVEYTIESQNLTLAEKPTWAGHEFKGWKLETAVGNWEAKTYDAGTPVTEKYGNVTLVAQWESTGNSLTYEYTGEHTPTDTSCTLPEEAIVTPDTEVTVFIPTAVGYTFSGWTPSVTSVQITEGKFRMPDEAVVLTGSWTPIKYTITYDYNNGDGTNPSKKVEATYTIEDAVKLMAAPAKADVPTDFRFTGWKLAQSVTAPNGNWTAGTFQAEKQFQDGCYGNITLVAQWERAAKDLTIRANSTDSDVNFVYTISGQDITITVAVPANSSVTIKSMPVGSYTITEKTAWSWRHTENYVNRSVTITKTEEEQSVVFDYNGNENKLWLNGYSYGKEGG